MILLIKKVKISKVKFINLDSSYYNLIIYKNYKIIKGKCKDKVQINNKFSQRTFKSYFLFCQLVINKIKLLRIFFVVSVRINRVSHPRERSIAPRPGLYPVSKYFKKESFVYNLKKTYRKKFFLSCSRCISDQIKSDSIGQKRLIIELLILTNSSKSNTTLADTANDLSISMDRYFLFPGILNFHRSSCSMERRESATTTTTQPQ